MVKLCQDSAEIIQVFGSYILNIYKFNYITSDFLYNTPSPIIGHNTGKYVCNSVNSCVIIVAIEIMWSIQRER